MHDYEIGPPPPPRAPGTKGGSSAPTGSAAVLTAEKLYKADLFDYLCWLEKKHVEETPELRGTDYLVMASDKTTCWAKTYADAVKVAMNHDKGIQDAREAMRQNH